MLRLPAADAHGSSADTDGPICGTVRTDPRGADCSLEACMADQGSDGLELEADATDERVDAISLEEAAGSTLWLPLP